MCLVKVPDHEQAGFNVFGGGSRTSVLARVRHSQDTFAIKISSGQTLNALSDQQSHRIVLR